MHDLTLVTTPSTDRNLLISLFMCGFHDRCSSINTPSNFVEGTFSSFLFLMLICRQGVMGFEELGEKAYMLSN